LSMNSGRYWEFSVTLAVYNANEIVELHLSRATSFVPGTD
jgi:hypothetical protein